MVRLFCAIFTVRIQMPKGTARNAARQHSRQKSPLLLCARIRNSMNPLLLDSGSRTQTYDHIIYEHMCRLKGVAEACMEGEMDFEARYYALCGRLVDFYGQYPLYFVSTMGNISIDEKDLEENTILKQIYEVGEEINEIMVLLFRKGIEENCLREDIRCSTAVCQRY